MGPFEYLYLKTIVFVLRLPIRLGRALYPSWNRVGLVPRSQSITPASTARVNSASSNRRIRILIHEPTSWKVEGRKGPAPVPVHINLHGSGFVLPLLGSDAELCQLIADTLDCIVIDGDYAKAPEFPFPNGLSDVVDIVNWVVSQPDRFDINKITIGGQSAGGGLALAAASSLPNGTIRAVATFYPSTDHSRRGLSDEQRMYKPFVPGETPGWALGRRARLFFSRCYVPDGADPKNPQLSPLFADPASFPPLFVVVGDADPLCKEDEALVQKISTNGGNARIMMIPDAGHAWERSIKKDDAKFAPLRKEAVDAIIDHIRKAQS